MEATGDAEHRESRDSTSQPLSWNALTLDSLSTMETPPHPSTAYVLGQTYHRLTREERRHFMML